MNLRSMCLQKETVLEINFKSTDGPKFQENVQVKARSV